MIPALPVVFLPAAGILAFFSVGLNLKTATGILCLDASFLIILSVPAVSRRFVALVVLLQLLSFVSVMFVSFFSKINPSPFLPLYFCIASCCPVGILLTGRIFSRCGDPAFLTSMLSGSEIVKAASVYIFSLYVFISEAIMSAAGFLPAPWPPIICVLVHLWMILVFLTLYVRVIIGRKRVKSLADYHPPAPGRVSASLSDVALFKKIEEYMAREQPFLNPLFSVDMLSRAICSNRGYISRSINSCSGYTFPRYVNNHRVEYAQKLFMSDMTLKVSALSEKSGFANCVSFTMAFRLATGENPKDWCTNRKSEVLKSKV